MPLPAAALLGALATAARVGGRIALAGGTKLFRGAARKVPTSKRTYLMSGGKYRFERIRTSTKIRKNKFARRTNVAKIPIMQRSLKRAGADIKNIGSEIKRHGSFYKKAIGPEGTYFSRLVTRPTFGGKNIKGAKFRKKAALYGGYYGAYKLFGED